MTSWTLTFLILPGTPKSVMIEMAKQGFTFEEILLYYYTDIEVR
jgi:hypothetical protein